MTKQDIIDATHNLSPLERIEIRDELNKQIDQDKQAYLAQGQKLYGRKPRKPRANKHHDGHQDEHQNQTEEH
jgi:hypothetical protein